MSKYYVFAYAWIIIVGGIMIIFGPRGPIVECIACGSLFAKIVGVISVVIGAVGLITSRSQRHQLNKARL